MSNAPQFYPLRSNTEIAHWTPIASIATLDVYRLKSFVSRNA